MPPNIIAIGSQNPAKVQAVRQVVERCWPAAALIPCEVPTGVSEMPFSDDACIRGAENRARAALVQAGADLGLGLEGGVQPSQWGLLLTGWVVAVDGRGRRGLGSTGRLPLPPAIAARVQAGEALGPVMDELLNQHLSNHRGGAIGALTAGLVPRSSAFAQAVAYALAPFVAPAFWTGHGSEAGT